MTINPLSSSISSLLTTEPVSAGRGIEQTGAGGSFADILTESLNTVSETDAVDKTSAVELLTGQSDDMSGLLLDAQKAEIALSFALQIRNKIVDGYNELMRMQV